MASNKSASNRELKYLGFVRVIAIKAIVCVWSMYEYAKEHSGPFKCCIGMKERVTAAVVRPFYNKFKGIPDDILFYFDNKVDKVINKFEEVAPALAKKLVIKLQPVVQKLIQIGQNLLQEAITAGVTAAIRSAMAESMKLMPEIPTLDSISNLSPIPIGDVAEKGLSILGDVPLNPIGGLANVFNKKKGDAEAASADGEEKIPTLDSISNLSPIPIGDVAEKGLSILGDVPLNPIGGLANVFNKKKGDAEATSAEGEEKTQ